MNTVLSVFVVILIGVCQSVSLSDSESRLIRYYDDRKLDKYRYSFETDNGISRTEIGEIIVIDNKEILAVRGSYAFTGNDGKRYIVTYTADENGYHPLIQNEEETLFLNYKFHIRGSPLPSAALASLAGGGLG